MKLFTIILILIIGCQEPEIKGCIKIGACNYNPDATFNDGSCEYVSDCLGVCGGSAVVDDCDECNGENVAMDCFGECGGSAIKDECGECGGDGSLCAGQVTGCMIETACNYNPIATYNNGSCEENDCFGECGGSAEVDDCGECGGDGSTCEAASGCMDNMANNYNSNATINDGSCTYTEHPENSLWFIPYSDGIWGIGYNASIPIGGFQFDIDGATISQASGGEAENEFSVTASGSRVIGFSIGGDTLPSGEHILTFLVLDGTPTGISSIVMSNSLGVAIPFTFNIFLTSLEETGFFQPTFFSSSITTLEVGDNIGIFDANGLTNYNDCSNQIGETLVGTGIWGGEANEQGTVLVIVSIGSVDHCAHDGGGVQLAGYVEGNTVLIKVYRPSTGVEYNTVLTWDDDYTGKFGETIQSVSEIELSY